MTIPAVAVTGYSGFFQTTGDSQPYAFLTTAQGGNRGRGEKRISKLLRRAQYYALRELMETLNGVAPGQTALATFPQVAAQATDPTRVTTLTELGGLRTVNTAVAINRVTTAADVTYIHQILTQRFGQAIASYPTVLGSGGGGKLGAF